MEVITWDKILIRRSKQQVAADMTMDPKDPNDIYMRQCGNLDEQPGLSQSGGENSALHKSTDAGKTWNKIHTWISRRTTREGLASSRSSLRC